MFRPKYRPRHALNATVKPGILNLDFGKSLSFQDIVRFLEKNDYTYVIVRKIVLKKFKTYSKILNFLNFFYHKKLTL